MLAAIFRFKLPEISSAPVLGDLIQSFEVETPTRPIRPPPWDLNMVLKYLNSSTFEPLAWCSLGNLTKKVLFLASLATARRVGELQAVSRYVSFVGSDTSLSYVLEFVANIKSSSHPLPCSLLVKSLFDFAAGLEDESLCPVSAYIFTFVGLGPSLILLVIFSCLLDFPLVPCPRMVSLSS